MLIGPQADQQQIEQFRQKIMQTRIYILHRANLGTVSCTDVTTDSVAERHIDLRPFVLSSPYRTELCQED